LSELPLEIDLLEAGPTQAPVYQRIADRALQLERLGLSHRRIASNLGVTGKTVTKAIAWRRRHGTS
jgi:hypothetical protein